MLTQIIAQLQRVANPMQQRRRAVSNYVDNRTSADFQEYAKNVTAQAKRLYQRGFSREAAMQFMEFCDMLREMYIFTAREEVIDRQASIVDTENQRVTYVLREVVPQVSIFPNGVFESKEPILLAARREYQLPAIATRGLSKSELRRALLPNLALVRALKEVIRASPIGDAVTEYRREHPFPSDPVGYVHPDMKRQGLPVSYVIAIFESLQGLITSKDSRESTFIPASDKADADFFVIANRLLSANKMFDHMSVFPEDDRYRLSSVCPNYGPHMEDCPGNTNKGKHCPKRGNNCPTARSIVLDDIATIPQQFADLFVTAMDNIRMYGSDPKYIEKYLHRATGGGVFERRAPVFDLFSENPYNLVSKAYLQGRRQYVPRVRQGQ